MSDALLQLIASSMLSENPLNRLNFPFLSCNIRFRRKYAPCHIALQHFPAWNHALAAH